MKIRIRDWIKYFERDRTSQWKNLQWVPIPNRQGSGYRRIMAQNKQGLEIFACWIALIQVASTCNPRGDLSKYDIDELCLLTMCPRDSLENAILYLSQTLDWIEIIENLDVNVKNIDIHGNQNCDSSSILYSSILSSSSEGGSGGKHGFNVPIVEKKQNRFIKPTLQELIDECSRRGNTVDPEAFFAHYESVGWKIGNKPMKNWKMAIVTWEKRNKNIRRPAFGRQELKKDDFIENMTIPDNGGGDGIFKLG